MDKEKQENIKNNKLITIASIIILLTGCVALINRSLLSVELTDEAYSVAAIYNASFGKKPFVDIWDPHTGWVLYVPFFKLFQVLSTGLKGVILYFRFVYLLLAAAVVGSCYLMAKKGDDLQIYSFLPFAACIGYVAFSVPQMGYNAGTSYLMMLVFCLLSINQSCWRHFFAGIFMGLSCILYPTIAVFAILLFIKLFLTTPVCQNIKWRLSGAYCGGVVIVGLIFFLWILSGGGNFEDLMTGIKASITTPHETNKGIIDGQFIYDTFAIKFYVFFTMERLVIWSVHIVASIIIKVFINRNRIGWALLYIEWMAYIMIATAEIFLCTDVQPISRGGYISFTIFASAFLVMLIMWKQTGYQLKMLSFITIGWILTYCFTSDNKNLFFAMDAAGALVFFYACYCALSLNIKNDIVVIQNTDAMLPSPKIVLSQIVFPALLLTVGISCYYGYVYRDASFSQLKHRVDYGVYTGLYTTEPNARYVERLEHDVESKADADDLFVANNMPAIYLMSRKRPYTPQTWDVQYLSRGYTSADPVLSYFKYKGKKPQVIYACDHLYPDLYKNSDIEIWQFIDDNYILLKEIDRQENGMLKIWKKKEKR